MDPWESFKAVAGWIGAGYTAKRLVDAVVKWDEGRRARKFDADPYYATRTVFLELPRAQMSESAWEGARKRGEALPADPFLESIPRFVVELGPEHLVTEYRKAAPKVDFKKDNPLDRVVRAAGSELEWHAIRPRALLANQRSEITRLCTGYLRSSHNKLTVHTLRPAPALSRRASEHDEYAKNVKSEVRFILRDLRYADRARAFRVTSNMIVTDFPRLLDAQIFSISEQAWETQALEEVLGAYDLLSRRMYAVGEFTYLAEIGRESNGILEVVPRNDPITYRGLRGPSSNIATFQWLILDKTGLESVERITHSAQYRRLIKAEIDSPRPNTDTSTRFTNEGIADLVDDVRGLLVSAPVSDSLPHYRDLDCKTLAERAAQQASAVARGTAHAGFDDFFRSRIIPSLGEAMCRDLMNAGLGKYDETAGADYDWTGA